MLHFIVIQNNGYKSVIFLGWKWNYSPSVCDLLRKIVLARAWSEGLDSKAKSKRQWIKKSTTDGDNLKYYTLKHLRTIGNVCSKIQMKLGILIFVPWMSFFVKYDVAVVGTDVKNISSCAFYECNKSKSSLQQAPILLSLFALCDIHRTSFPNVVKHCLQGHKVVHRPAVRKQTDWQGHAATRFGQRGKSGRHRRHNKPIVWALVENTESSHPALHPHCHMTRASKWYNAECIHHDCTGVHPSVIINGKCKKMPMSRLNHFLLPKYRAKIMAWKSVRHQSGKRLKCNRNSVQWFVPVLSSCTVSTLQGDVWTGVTMSWEQQNWQKV